MYLPPPQTLTAGEKYSLKKFQRCFLGHGSRIRHHLSVAYLT
jgi:hypothetical protein